MTIRKTLLLFLCATLNSGCASTLAEDLYAWDAAPIKRFLRNLKRPDSSAAQSASAATSASDAGEFSQASLSPVQQLESRGLWAELSIDPHTLIAWARVRNDGPGACSIQGTGGSGLPAVFLLSRADGKTIDPFPPVVLWRGVQNESLLEAGNELRFALDLRRSYGPLVAGNYRLRLRGIPGETAAFSVNGQ